MYNPVSQDAGAQTLEEVTQTPQAAEEPTKISKPVNKWHKERLGVVYKHTSSSYYFQAKSYILHRDFDNALGFSVRRQRLIFKKFVEASMQKWAIVIPKTSTTGFWVLISIPIRQEEKFWQQLWSDWQHNTRPKETYSDFIFYLLNSFRITDKLNSEVNF